MSGRRRLGDVNEGIQGSVTADVVAVGRGAQAVKVVRGAGSDAAELRRMVVELRQAVDALSLKPLAEEAVREDLKKLEQAVAKPAPDRDAASGALQNLAGKLKMVGILLTETASLCGPVKKIAELLRLSLSALGLG